MSGKPFIFILVSLIFLLILSSPPVLGPLVRREPTSTLTPTPVTPTATPTATLDPFAHVPTATPLSGQVAVLKSLPTPSGELPPTFTPTPTPIGVLALLLPDPQATPIPALDLALPTSGPVAGLPPEQIRIPRLELRAPVEPVGLIGLDAVPGAVAPLVPDHRAAGWLNSSTGLGASGNIILVGQYEGNGAVFRDLWLLASGDEIRLYAAKQERRYVVTEVWLLPEQGQPLEVRLSNAEHLQPTHEEQLTLVTGWPDAGKTGRTVVVARLEAEPKAEE